MEESLLEAPGHPLHDQAHLAERHHHLVGGGVLLLGGERDLARHPRGVAGGLAQGRRWRRPPSARPLEHPARLLAPLLGRHDGGADRAGELVEQAAHRIDRVLRAVGEAAHLLGDHREAPALGPRRRRLDGGVQRQDVGLLGDLGDQVEDAVDLLGAGAQVVGALGDAADARRTSSTPSTAASTARAPASPLASARAASSAWRAALLGDLRRGARQLLHGGGDLDHRGRLLGRAGGEVRGDRLTSSAAAATSIEPSWMLLGEPDSAAAAAARPAARPPAGSSACSRQRTRSPEPRCSNARARGRRRGPARGASAAAIPLATRRAGR